MSGLPGDLLFLAQLLAVRNQRGQVGRVEGDAGRGELPHRLYQPGGGDGFVTGDEGKVTRNGFSYDEAVVHIRDGSQGAQVQGASQCEVNNVYVRAGEQVIHNRVKVSRDRAILDDKDQSWRVGLQFAGQAFNLLGRLPPDFGEAVLKPLQIRLDQMAPDAGEQSESRWLGG